MLVALLVLSITTAFVVVVAQAVKTTYVSVHEDLAFHIAENELDILRAGGYAALPSSGSAFSDPALADLPGSSASTSVNDWNSETRQIAASVGWRETGGVAHVVTLTTLVAKIGGL